MKRIPFNLEVDLSPIPFNRRHCQLAGELKSLGLPWTPHVGCFVWDPDNYIPAESPFPNRIYFILSLPRFLDMFGSLDEIGEKLVWLPTWHQARLMGERLGVSTASVKDIWHQETVPAAGEEILRIYGLLKDALQTGA